MDAIAKLGAEDAERSERRKLGRRLWESCFATDRLIWISQLPELPSAYLSDVLQGLGLYHLESRMANEPFVQFVFKTSECFKPTWVDAALAFYFDAAPGAPESGLTRNLANGASGYREWVTRKAGLTLVDVRVWSLDKRMAFHKPSVMFGMVLFEMV